MKRYSVIGRLGLCLTLPLCVGGFSLVGLAQTASTQAVSPSSLQPTTQTNLVVAKGKGFQISRDELDEEVIRFKADLARLGRTVPPDQEALVDRSVLESLIQLKMLWAKATTNEIDAARKIANERIEKERNAAGDEESFQRRLRVAGLTEDQFRNRLVEINVAELVLERLLGVKVTDTEVKKFYDENPDQFEEPEAVKVAHILFLTRDPNTGKDLSEAEKEAKLKKAKDALKRIKEGEDFGKVAQEVSEDPGTRDNGGVISGMLTRGRLANELPEFEAAAFKLGTNQVSDVVSSSIGYHIIKVLEKRPARMIEFDKVSEDIRRYLKRQQIQAGARKLFEDLKKEFGVEILDEKLKAVKLPEVSGAATNN